MSVAILAGFIASFLLTTTKTTILNFDGSWQPSTTLFNKQPLASCAAVICREEPSPSSPYNNECTCNGDTSTSTNGANNVNNNYGLALGAKVLCGCPSSAHSEYEGLILGLKYLVDEEAHQGTNFTSTQEDTCSVLVVRGDCKTVITQLSGTSLPRVLMDKYDEASSLIEILRGRFSRISYVLVDRSENQLSDALAREVLKIVQSFSYTVIYERCKSMIHENKEGSDDGVFCAGLNLINGYSLLLPIQRYALLSRLSDDLMPSDDDSYCSSTTAKLKAGRLLKLGASICQLSHNIYALNKNERGGMFAEGLRYEILAKHRLGLEQEALAMEHKFRYKLKVSPLNWIIGVDLHFTLANDEESNSARQTNERIKLYVDQPKKQAFEAWQKRCKTFLASHCSTEYLSDLSSDQNVPIFWIFVPTSDGQMNPTS